MFSTQITEEDIQEYQKLKKFEQEICAYLEDRNYNFVRHRFTEYFNVTPLHIAVLLENAPLVNTLIAHGADANAFADDKITPLHLVALTDNVSIAHMLLAKKANIKARDARRKKPLYWAVEADSPNVARLLAEHTVMLKELEKDRLKLENIKLSIKKKKKKRRKR